jgi:hypothetical protein
MGHAVATITIHRSAAAANKRRPAFISPSTQSIAISVYPVDGGGNIAPDPIATTYADLTPQSPNCTGTDTVVCSVSVPAPPGTDAFGVQLFSQPGEGGSVIGALLPSPATERTIVAGANNVALPLVIGGVPAAVTISAGVTRFVQGTPASVPLTVVATDGAGNMIVGSDPYANPITLTNSDVSGAVTLSTTTLTSPAGTVTLTYTGGSLTGPPTIGGVVSSGSVTPLSFQYVSGSVSLTCSPSCSGLANGPAPYPLTAHENGYDAQPMTIGISGIGCQVDPSGSTSASGGSVIANVYGPPGGGSCTVTATDIAGNTNGANLTFVPAGTPSVVSICGDGLPKPGDPNGGNLYVDVGCGNAGVLYGSYLFVPLDSTYNPISFQIAVYANPNQAAITQMTVGGNRYINGVAVSPPYVNYSGQDGTTQVPISSLAGMLVPQ